MKNNANCWELLSPDYYVPLNEQETRKIYFEISRYIQSEGKNLDIQKAGISDLDALVELRIQYLTEDYGRLENRKLKQSLKSCRNTSEPIWAKICFAISSGMGKILFHVHSFLSLKNR